MEAFWKTLKRKSCKSNLHSEVGFARVVGPPLLGEFWGRARELSLNNAGKLLLVERGGQRKTEVSAKVAGEMARKQASTGQSP